MSIKNFIKRNPVLIYFALTLTISSGAVLAVIGLTGMPTTKEEMAAVLPVAIVAQLIGPSVSGLLMIGFVDGKAGFQDLQYRLSSWKIGVPWYAIALFLGPIIIMAVLITLSISSPVYLPGIFTTEDKMALLTMGIFSAILVGICEELGWTGFVTPKLRQRYSVLFTGLIVGVMWGIWHIVPMAIMPSLVYSAPFSPTIYITIRTINFLVGGLVAFRVLMLWAYGRTQSLMLLILMHIGLTAANIIFEPEALGGISAFVYDLVEAALMWIVVLMVFIFKREQLLGKAQTK